MSVFRYLLAAACAGAASGRLLGRRYAAARRWAERSLSLEPHNELALLVLGEALLELGLLSAAGEALDEARAVMERAPDLYVTGANHDAYRRLRWLQARLRDNGRDATAATDE